MAPTTSTWRTRLENVRWRWRWKRGSATSRKSCGSTGLSRMAGTAGLLQQAREPLDGILDIHIVPDAVHGAVRRQFQETPRGLCPTQFPAVVAGPVSGARADSRCVLCFGSAGADNPAQASKVGARAALANLAIGRCRAEQRSHDAEARRRKLADRGVG